MPPDVRFSADYRRFWAAAALSNLGDGVRLAALPLLAVTLTDDPVAIALVVALSHIPWLVVGPLGGVIVDRVDRRRLMVVGQIARGAAVAILAIWLVVAEPPLLAVYVVSFVLGAGEVFVDTASQAAVPLLAPPGQAGLERANGRLIAAQTLLDEVVGAPIGATLFTVAVALPFALDAATFVLSAALLLLVRTPLQTERGPSASSIREDLREGFAAMWQSPLLRGMAIGVGLINVALSATFAMLVLFVLDVLGGSETSYGVLLAVGALGGFVGALVASRIVRRAGRRVTIVAMMIVAGAATTAMAFAGSVAVLAALLFVSVFAVIVSNVTGVSIRQAAVAPEVLGRVVASYRVIGMLGVPVGAVLGGAIASFADVRAVYLCAGVFSVIPILAIASATRDLPADGATTGTAEARGPA